MTARIPMSAPDIAEEDVQAVAEVVRSGRLAVGPKTGGPDAQDVGMRRAAAVRPRAVALRMIVWALVLSYLGFLGYMSLGRGYTPTLDRALASGGSTLLHLGGYGLLAILLAWTMPWGSRRRPWHGGAAAFAYGALLEVLQLLIPERTPSVLDLGINLAGALAGGACFWVAARVRTWRCKSEQEAVDSGL